MLLLASAVFGLSMFSYGVVIIPFLLILFLFGIALGIIGTSLVLRLGPAAEWFVWPIPAIVSPFAGVFYPVATLPVWMQYVSYLLPPSYVFEGVRTVAGGGSVPMQALLWGGSLSVIYILLSAGIFAHVYRGAVRTGLIARYSAESVT